MPIPTRPRPGAPPLSGGGATRVPASPGGHTGSASQAFSPAAGGSPPRLPRLAGVLPATAARAGGDRAGRSACAQILAAAPPQCCANRTPPGGWSARGYRDLTAGILGLHFAFVAYAVLLGFLAWRWPHTIPGRTSRPARPGLGGDRGVCSPPHSPAPRTVAAAAGSRGRNQIFDRPRYIEGVIYPERLATLMQVLAATVVAVSWLGFARLRRRPQGDGATVTARATGGWPPRRPELGCS